MCLEIDKWNISKQCQCLSGLLVDRDLMAPATGTRVKVLGVLILGPSADPVFISRVCNIVGRKMSVRVVELARSKIKSSDTGLHPFLIVKIIPVY